MRQQDWGLAAVLIAMTLGGVIVWSLLNAPPDYLVIAVIFLGAGVGTLAAALWSVYHNRGRPEPNWYRGDTEREPHLAALVDALVNESRANREEQQREEKLNYPIELLTLFAVLVTASFVIFQWHEMVKVYDPVKTSAEAAKTAAEAAKTQAAAAGNQIAIMKGQLDAMQADQRPWIKVEATADEIIPFNITHGAGAVPFHAKLTNTGKSPAFNVRVFPWTFIVTEGHDDFITEQRERCEKVRTEPIDSWANGYVLFPNDTVIDGQGQGIVGGIMPGIVPIS